VIATWCGAGGGACQGNSEYDQLNGLTTNKLTYNTNHPQLTFNCFGGAQMCWATGLGAGYSSLETSSYTGTASTYTLVTVFEALSDTTTQSFLFGGTAFTGVTGTGTLTGPIFRILSIPTTTTLTFYTTVTAATAGTSTTFQPVFLLPNIPLPASGLYSGGPTLTGVAQPNPWIYPTTANIITGANCTVQYCPSNWAGSGNALQLVYDATTGNTPTAAPTMRTIVPASSQGQLSMMTPGTGAIVASTTSAGTTYASVME
jgi:hypothetical protein